MKTIAILTVASLCSCGPVQETDPAGVSQVGVINFFRGSPTAGDVDELVEAPAVIRRDNDEALPETKPTIETSTR